MKVQGITVGANEIDGTPYTQKKKKINFSSNIFEIYVG